MTVKVLVNGKESEFEVNASGKLVRELTECKRTGFERVVYRAPFFPIRIDKGCGVRETYHDTHSSGED